VQIRHSPPPRNLTVAAVDEGHLGVAQPHASFDQRIDHRLQVEGRAADDLQHVAGRGLVFERRVGSARRLKFGSISGLARSKSRIPFGRVISAAIPLQFRFKAENTPLFEREAEFAELCTNIKRLDTQVSD
jgi:hypothetical protein